MDVYAGIDVSKGRLDVAVRPAREQWSVANDLEGADELVAKLEDLRPSLVVLEASGGYERPVVAALAAAGLPVTVVNPRRARDAARGDGEARQDRLAGCAGAGSFRRGGEARGAAGTRRAGAGVRRNPGPKAAGGGDAGGRGEQAGDSDSAC